MYQIIWINCFSSGKWLPDEEKRLAKAVYELTACKPGLLRLDVLRLVLDFNKTYTIDPALRNLLAFTVILRC